MRSSVGVRPQELADPGDVAVDRALGIVHRQDEQLDTGQVNGVDGDLPAIAQHQRQARLAGRAAIATTLQPDLQPRHEILVAGGEAVETAQAVSGQCLRAAIAEALIQLGIDDENRP
ncbi:hypothetical protein [Bosea sp. UC22_33]|uniref:hypothetical protein n=1 Tax=Bosea sp. UC22_33 TaxID=3350165 RepID=UPI0036708E14